MRTHRTVLFSLGLLLAIGALSAHPCQAQQPLKIGVFDAERTSRETEEGQRLYAQLNEQGQAYEAELQTLQDQLTALQEQYQATSLSLSEAKRAELKQLLEVEIPKTLKGINAAAAEGDLSENFEYHMLRDRQELQSARAAMLQAELAQVRILEPGSANTSQVNIGTMVHLADSTGTELPPITILGDWDADIDRRIFAAGSELAQGLPGVVRIR